MRNRWWIGLGFLSVAVTATLSFASYSHARTVANQVWAGRLPHDLFQFHGGLLPIGRPPEGGGWGWRISYGPELHDDHASVFVSPLGRVIGTNPPDLRERLARLRSQPIR